MCCNPKASTGCPRTSVAPSSLDRRSSPSPVRPDAICISAVLEPALEDALAACALVLWRAATGELSGVAPEAIVAPGAVGSNNGGRRPCSGAAFEKRRRLAFRLARALLDVSLGPSGTHTSCVRRNCSLWPCSRAARQSPATSVRSDVRAVVASSELQREALGDRRLGWRMKPPARGAKSSCASPHTDGWVPFADSVRGQRRSTVLPKPLTWVEAYSVREEGRRRSDSVKGSGTGRPRARVRGVAPKPRAHGLVMS